MTSRGETARSVEARAGGRCEFRWNGHELVGQTPTGRATVLMLDVNQPRRMLIRRAEQLFALFPP
jgi:hypothetical protein